MILFIMHASCVSISGFEYWLRYRYCSDFILYHTRGQAQERGKKYSCRDINIINFYLLWYEAFVPLFREQKRSQGWWAWGRSGISFIYIYIFFIQGISWMEWETVYQSSRKWFGSFSRVVNEIWLFDYKKMKIELRFTNSVRNFRIDKNIWS